MESINGDRSAFCRLKRAIQRVTFNIVMIVVGKYEGYSSFYFFISCTIRLYFVILAVIGCIYNPYSDWMVNEHVIF